MAPFVGHSPVLTQLSATLDGIHTIRAFNVQHRLTEDFDEHYNTLCGAWFSHIGIFGWFQFHIDLIAALFSTAATFGCLLVVDYNLFGKTNAAMAISI